ncbi:MAG: TonB-dependent receptor [Hydrogenophilaceae bacterium]|jgi:iron complex outermembrane receptor protein|nr:TonB-dependent receptor [Hydrogenophilaceae bacterium]
MKIAMRSLLGASCALPLFMFTGGGIAAAQEATEAEATDETTIVVTARRRAESLQDTPVAVTVMTGEALERQQIISTTDLDQAAPNLQFAAYGTLTGNNSAAQVFIRGIGQTDATPAVDPGVGVYIDDVYMGRAVGAAMEFRDVDSVQVLRGPQGTLFGRNTIGGAVLITTNAPGEGAGNSIRVGLGEDNLREAYGAFELPIGETLAARVALGLRQRDGYVTRAFDGLDLGDENMYTGQLAVRWTPSDSFEITMRADYTEEDENGSPFVFRSINETAAFPMIQSAAAGCPGSTFPPPVPVPMIDDPRCANDFQALGPFTNGGTAPAFSTLETSGVSLVAEWELNDVLTLKSITSDRHLEWSGARDADNTPLTILHTRYQSRSDQFSQELQALIETDRLSGVVGYYFFDETSFDRLIVPLGGPGTSYDTQRVNLDAEAWAAFTNWTLDLTDALSVSAGVRYTEETKGLQATMFNVAGANTPEPPAPTALCATAAPTAGCLFILTNRFEREFSSTIGSASAQYRFNPGFMAYLSWSQGFKSGGFNQRYNARPQASGEPISFNDETAETYELGFKSNPAPGVRLNGAIFSTEYDDIQLTYRLGVVPLLFNAGVATIEGAEFELAVAPTPDFLLDASLSYLDAGFDSINNPAPIGGVTPTSIATLNSELPFAPEWQAHIGLSYTFHPRSGLLLTPRLDLSYTDSQFFDAGNSASIAQNDAVTVLNGSLALEPEDSRWRIMLSGNNLTDELYPVAGTSSETTATGYAEIIYARPRSFWATLSYRF